jgi:MFS family permease
VAERSHRLLLTTLFAAAGVYVIQTFMVLPVLPALQQEFDTSTAWVTWVFTGFVLSAGIATPLLSKLGDEHGRKRLLQVSLVLFVVGAAGAAAAPSLWVLIACRVLQGASGATVPLTLSIMGEVLPRHRVGPALALQASIVTGAGAAGIALAGPIVEALSWRYLFGLTAVGGAAMMVAVHRYVPDPPERQPARIDLVGAGLLAASLGCLLLALTEGASWGWASARTIGLLAACGALAGAWALVELRTRSPLVDLHMLGDRTVMLANTTTLLAQGIGNTGVFILVPRLATASPADGYGFGASLSSGGLYLVPALGAGVIGGPLAIRVGQRLGWRAPLALGLVLSSLAIFAAAKWHDEPWQVLLEMTVLGVTVPLTAAPCTTMIAHVVRPTELSIALGMNAVSRQIGAVIGGQLVAAVLTSAVIADTSVPTEHAFVLAFAICGAASLVSLALMAILRPGRGAVRAAVAGATE